MQDPDPDDPGPTQIGQAPAELQPTQVGTTPVQLDVTRMDEAPAELQAEKEPDEEADETQSPGLVPDREHPMAAAPAAAAHAALRGKDFGQWAEPKVRKKKKDPMIGRMVAGRYEISGLLGKGGMGAVYKARQRSVQRPIALKVLLQEFAENETVIKRFHQEALAASRLTHPNTIKVYDFGQTDDGILYIAMEYLRGQSLAQAVGRGKAMPPKRVVHIMRQVCKSLSEAHKQGIIHRDLKPDNIFLVDIQGERDFVKVLDFGVAKLKEFEGSEGTLTQAGMIFGTPKYMSPEQARSGSLDPRSDVYALGVILYEMIVGRAPFVGENPLSILISHVNEHPPPFRQINAEVDVPPALEAVVFKALNKRREHRHDSVEELLIELEAVDALLDGASYESVADRLPGVIPGADGTPSLVGPAIVPAGTDETQRGLQRSGNTVRLDGEGNPVDGAVLVVEEEEALAPVGGGFPLWALAAAVPVLGLGIWLFTRTPEVVAPGDAGAPVSAAPPSVATAPSGTPASVSPKSAGSVAAPSVASTAPASEAEGREFMVRSTPDKARIIDLESGKQVGITYARLKVSQPTTYVLRKSGYISARIELDPADEDTVKMVELKARPEPAKPDPPPKDPKRVVVRRPATAPPARPARPITKPPDDTIDIE